MIELKVSELVANCLLRMIDGEISFQEKLIVKEDIDGLNDGKTRQTIIKEMRKLKEDIERKEDK